MIVKYFSKCFGHVISSPRQCTVYKRVYIHITVSLSRDAVHVMYQHFAGTLNVYFQSVFFYRLIVAFIILTHGSVARTEKREDSCLSWKSYVVLW
jgi:hypothetical protein